MNIEVAKSAGFCFGVKIAIDKVEGLLDKNQKVMTLGHLIHNNFVVDNLKSKGVVTIEDIDKHSKDHTVVIRSHGVSKSVYDYIENENVNFEDATCPFVKKIHNIVAKESVDRNIFIAGDKNHAEIIGINGFCQNKAFIFNSVEELKEKIKAINPDYPISLVSQTTFNIQKWEIITDFIKKHCTNLKIFATICGETTKRQTEAIELSKKMDCMLVIGSLHSSNSIKLRDVCSQYAITYLIESASDIDGLNFKDVKNVGITAGASTPNVIIEEVLNKVSSNVNNENEDFCFEEALEKSLSPIYRNQFLKGVVTSISSNEVQMDIGKKQTGIIHISELTNDSSAKCEDIVKKGDEIEVMVLKVNDLEGTVMLSKRRVDAISQFSNIEKAFEDGSTLEGKVIEILKGGLLVLTDGIRVFIPASQSGLRMGEDLNILKNEIVKFKIIDIDKSKKRSIGSIKVLSDAKRKEMGEKFWASAEKGKTYKGVVKSLTNYGVFVDLDGANGMIHISELSWYKINHPKEIVSIGDVLDVYIKDVDFENKKISLGYKKEEDNPWINVSQSFKNGDIVKVKIVSITNFGVFVELVKGVDGLIHISQIDNKKIDKISNVLSIGQEVDAKLIEFDPENKRVSLSIKAILEDKEKAEDEQALKNYTESLDDK